MTREENRMARWVIGLVTAAIFLPGSAAAQAPTCKGVAEEHVSSGRVVTFRLDEDACKSQKNCPGGAACQRLTADIPATGGFKEWCGCQGTPAATDCQTVIVHPPVPPEEREKPRGRLEEPGALDCLARCPNPGEQCCEVLISSKPFRRGEADRLINRYVCKCLAAGELENGECPTLDHPGVKPKK